MMVVAAVEKTFAWTTPEEAIRAEGRHWRARSIAERVSAVEVIRRATPGIYRGVPGRLARVHRLVDLAPRTLPRRRRPRARRRG
jgi:hypothetical protein